MKLTIALILALLTWAAVRLTLARRGVNAAYRGRHRRPGHFDHLVDAEGRSDRRSAEIDTALGGHHQALEATRTMRLAVGVAPVVAAGLVFFGVLSVSGFFAGPDDDPGAEPSIPTTTTNLPVQPRDGTGNPTSTEPAGSTPATTPPSEAGLVRGVFGRDSSPTGFEAILATSFNAVLVGANRAELDEIHAAGLQGVVWLGEYDRTTPCGFEFSDGKVTAELTAIAGHPAIAAYFLADEPSIARAESCPSAPSDLRQRSDLVHSLDSTNPTMVTLTTWDGSETFPYSHWVGTADIFGLVVYPCFQGSCDFSLIDQAIAAAESAGLGEYWAIIQDFADSWYDLPTPDQVNEQFVRWSGSDMTGYLVFAADGFDCCQPSDFQANSDKRTVLQTWNSS